MTDQENAWEEYMAALMEAFEHARTGTSMIPPFMYYNEDKGEWELV